jgi:hypothetical protein
MLTSHEVARQLLAGPDLELFVESGDLLGLTAGDILTSKTSSGRDILVICPTEACPDDDGTGFFFLRGGANAES